MLKVINVLAVILQVIEEGIVLLCSYGPAPPSTAEGAVRSEQLVSFGSLPGFSLGANDGMVTLKDHGLIHPSPSAMGLAS